MKHRRLYSILVLTLAMFLGMGTVVSAVQANDMVLKMAMAGEAGSSGTNGCTACGGNEGGAQQADCLPACVTIACGLLAATAAIAIDATDSPSIVPNIPPRGSTGVLDPSPPRLSILG